MGRPEIFHVAIDGPSGAGKSTLAKALAGKLNITYLDTGAMYRAIGLAALRKGCATKDETSLEEILNIVDLSVRYIDGVSRVFLNGEDVTSEIRTQPVAMAASDVSSLPIVRKKLVALQRHIAKDQSIVLDGRDIGTNVLPQAQFKFFITADAAVRAQRRVKELAQKGISSDFETVLAQIKLRDEQDQNRAIHPLRPAADAHIVATDTLNAEQVVTLILSIIREYEK